MINVFFSNCIHLIIFSSFGLGGLECVYYHISDCQSVIDAINFIPAITEITVKFFMHFS